MSKLESLRIDPLIPMMCRLVDVQTGSESGIIGGIFHVYRGRYLTKDEMRLLGNRKFPVYKIKLHSGQYELCMEREPGTTILVHAGRQVGKSTGSSARAKVQMLLKPGVKGQIVSPTVAKTRIMWGYVLSFIPKEMIHKVSLSRLTITLKNGSSVQFLSAHKPDALIGESVEFMHFDESQSISQIAKGFALPALMKAGKNYSIVHTGTPRQSWKEERDRVEADPKGKIIHFDPRKHNAFIDTSEGSTWDQLVNAMSEEQYRQEILGEFISQHGYVYHKFSIEQNVRTEADLRAAGLREVTKLFTRDKGLRGGGDFLIGVDWGANRQFAVVFKVYEYQGCFYLIVIDEVLGKKNYLPQDLANELNARGYHGSPAIDDASGRWWFNSTAVLSKNGFPVFNPRKNPDVSDRFMLVNRFLGKEREDDSPRLFIHPRCKELITSLDELELINGRQDKSRDLDHICDAMGYPICFLFKELNQTYRQSANMTKRQYEYLQKLKRDKERPVISIERKFQDRTEEF